MAHDADNPAAVAEDVRQVVEDLQAALEISAAADPWWKPRWNVAPQRSPRGAR